MVGANSLAMKQAAKSRKRAANAPSITEVAARAGVSVATVSRVVNGVSARYSEKTEARVRAAIAEMNYRPASVGRALRQGESRMVAVLAASLGNPTMAAIAASTEAALREAGYVMVLCDTHDRPEIQDEYLLEMRAQFATAIVLLGAVKSPQLDAFRAAGARLLFVNRRDPFAKDDPFVGIDNRRAGREVAELFDETGEGKIGLIHGPLTSSATQDRVTGFCERLADLRPQRPPNVVSPAETDHLLIGYEGAAALLAEDADLEAVFCLSDLIAFGAARRLRETGKAVPDDIRVVGFDDSPLNDWVAPWLTSVRVPYEGFGHAIVSALSRLMSGEGAFEIVLEHTIVRRDGDRAAAHGEPAGT